MAIVLNATNETVSTKAHGNWFTFKPKQYKILGDDLAAFLTSNRADEGLVYLPEEFSDPTYSRTPEGQEAFARAEAEGIERYVAKLREVVNNNIISMKKDLQIKNIQTDPRAFMSEGEMHALEQLSKYQNAGHNAHQQRVERVKELEKQLGVNNGESDE